MAQIPQGAPFIAGAPLPPFPVGYMPPATGAPPFAVNAPPPTQPTMVNGIPVAKQPLNTTPSRTVYVSNLNEKVKLDGKTTRLKKTINIICLTLFFFLYSFKEFITYII